MRTICMWILIGSAALALGQACAADSLRPPAVPLVAHDPYLSIWSMADRLTDDATRHWTNREHPLNALIRIDGRTYRLIGTLPKEAPALPQTATEVLPARTICRFANSAIKLTLTFTTPVLPESMDVLARPVTYLSWRIVSADGRPHAVTLLQTAGARIAVNTPEQKVRWGRESVPGLEVVRVGSADQTLLQPAGDDARINWGYLYLAAPASTSRASIAPMSQLLGGFVPRGRMPIGDDTAQPRAAGDQDPALALGFNFGLVSTASVERHALIAYDEVYAIQFLGRKLRPYWRRGGATMRTLLEAAERDYPRLAARCEAFDREMMADLTRAGGVRYARMCALAYRQALAGCGWAADANGQPLIFTKENTSNGCIATTDVFYPAAPQFLLMGASYAKALVAPVLIYSASSQWKFPFAPHDIGVYPQANAQVYGGGESPGNEADKMPVEESANMILLCAAIARMEGNAGFASRWWPQLTRWEAYLEKYGLDPENQLCTDDFMGHLAHNANLSVKAILAIAAYGDLCRLRGDHVAAKKYLAIARADARNWMKVAADGNHYRIAFDRPGTWSQKYNLVWDRLLGLNVFPPAVAATEMAHYQTVMQKYGLPLDSRTKLTKTDWSVWTATMATNRAGFERIVSPIYDYLNDTTARMPFVDSYITNNPKSDGMHARPVIGGLFIRMLADPAVWKKWASRDTTKAGNWAPAPLPPIVTEVVPTSDRRVEWRYTTSRPEGAWYAQGFDDAAWLRGPGGFGSAGTPGAVLGTEWRSPDIWLRRDVTLPARLDRERLQLRIYHDEDVEVYLNGVLAARLSGYTTSYVNAEIAPAALASLKPGGTALIAIHCHQTTGGQGVDAGLVSVRER